MRDRRNQVYLTAFIVLLVASSIMFQEVDSQVQNDLTGVKIAVYDGGSGSGTSDPRESSMAALYWMFHWMNATVEIVNSTTIKAGELDSFQIVAVPGGYAYDYYLDLGYIGANAIRSFVSKGGGYWGACAGAYYACQEFEWTEYGHTGTYHYGLNLFSGCGVGPIIGIADWPNYEMTDIRMNTTNGIIDLPHEPNIHSIMYYGGPYFETEGVEGVITIATYCYNDMPAMIAFEYEQGRVFLTGPHPEWEEDSFRDGCLWDNSLDDNGTDWEICKAAALWLVHSGNIPNDNPYQYLQIVIVLATSISIAAVVAFIAYSRRN